MPEETVTSDVPAVAPAEQGGGQPDDAPAFESPPPAAMPERRAFDPQARLAELAVELVRTQNRRLLVEYLRLRRAV